MTQGGAPLCCLAPEAPVVVCDQVNEVDAVHEVDKVDDVHQVDPVHQVHGNDEVRVIKQVGKLVKVKVRVRVCPCLSVSVSVRVRVCLCPCLSVSVRVCPLGSPEYRRKSPEVDFGWFSVWER